MEINHVALVVIGIILTKSGILSYKSFNSDNEISQFAVWAISINA